MTTRRLGAAAIIVASLLAGTACQSGEDGFKPDAEGYLELACSLERHQRDLSAAEVAADAEVERRLAYVASTALLESGNRELDTELQDLSAALRTAIDQDDGPAFDEARGDVDKRCEDHDLSVKPDGLVDIACSIAEGLKPGPLAAAGGRLVVKPGDPMDLDHPDQAAIADFQRSCPSGTTRSRPRAHRRTTPRRAEPARGSRRGRRRRR